MILRRFLPRMFLVLLIATGTGFADTYHYATFTGQLNSSVNIKAPFNSVLSGSGPVSGNFVYDDQLIPGGGTGFVNVFFSSFPDIASIPEPTAFTLDLGGGLVFTLADALNGYAAIQYNNGAFNGFFYVSDFTFLGNPYRFRMEGGTYYIRALVNGAPTTTNLVTGRLNVGNSNLSGVAVYVPGQTTEVPEPSSLVFFGTGLAACVGAIRRRLNS